MQPPTITDIVMKALERGLIAANNNNRRSAEAYACLLADAGFAKVAAHVRRTLNQAASGDSG